MIAYISFTINLYFSTMRHWIMLHSLISVICRSNFHIWIVYHRLYQHSIIWTHLLYFFLMTIYEFTINYKVCTRPLFVKTELWKINEFRVAIAQITSSSIRRLDLHAYTWHRGWHSFNNQQCIALCKSPLGFQCEVLRIRVANSMNVLELVRSMLYLRALNVQILDDQYNIHTSRVS